MFKVADITRDKVLSFVAFLKRIWQPGITVSWGKAMGQHFCVAFIHSEGDFCIAVGHKTRVAPDDISLLQIAFDKLAQNNIPFILLADGMSASTAARMRELGLNYFQTGDMAFLKWPGFTYVVQAGSATIAKRSEPNANTVFTGKGSRLCRILLSHPDHSWKQVELARRSGLTRGYVSQLVNRMLLENYLRVENSRYFLNDRDILLDAWAKVYRFHAFQVRQQYAVAMKDYHDGLKKLAAGLKELKIPFAFTGWSAAALRAPFTEPQSLMAYVGNLPEKLAGFFPVDQGGNVMLYVPNDTGRLQEGFESDGYPLVCDVQAYLDLKKMPGRADDQAEYLRDRFLRGR